MEEVDVKEFYSVSTTTVQSNCGMSWSEDHKVTFITTTALHVMEVAPNSSSTSTDLCLKRSTIKPTDDAPTVRAGIDVNRLLFQLDQRNTYRLLLDMKLSPHLNDAKNVEARYTSALWSPASMYQDHRCILATLTNTGSLKLHVPHVNSWIEAVDVSVSWLEHCKLQWTESFSDSSGESEKVFAILQNRCSQIKITAMIWGDLVNGSDNERCSHMATISHNGTLAIWKLDYLRDLGIPVQNYKPTLVITCNTDLYNAHAMHWLRWNEEHISVIVGDMKGRVKIISFICNSTINMSVLNMEEIWNEDDIEVSCIKSLPSTNMEEPRVLAVIKESFFLAFLVTPKGLISLCHEKLGGLPITGLEVLNEKSFLITTLNGTLCKCSVSVNESEGKRKITVFSRPLSSNVAWQDLACFGVAKSTNGHLWTIGTNLCKMYDHLVVRRPSQILFATVCEIEDPLKQLDIGSCTENNSFKLRHHLESVEMMRMNYVKQLKAQTTKNLEISEDLEKLSTAQLQLELWRARLAVSQLLLTDVVVRNPETCAYATLLEELILCRHMCSFICALAEKHEICSLDEPTLRIAGRLRSWLQIWITHQNNIECATDKNNEVKSVTTDSPEAMNANTDDTAVEMDITDNTQNSVPSSSSGGSVTDVSENVGDNDAVSVCSFDDAVSTDSNSSSTMSGKNMLKRLQHGRIPASFLKIKLSATLQQVMNVLSLPIMSSAQDKDVCAFCEQEILMDIDWRFGACSSNHRLPRCSQCLSQCLRMPYRQCLVCPTVSCLTIDQALEPFCIFCDSPLIVDEKFKKPGFPPPRMEPPIAEEKEEEEENVGNTVKEESGECCT